jgi:hypothetical protein
LVDLDGDGRTDVLSGSWPGELFLFRGGPDRTFLAPEKLKDREGKTINIGGGFQPAGADGMILIAGDVKFEQKDGKAIYTYEGKVLDVPEGKQVGITGTASAAHAADWDGDGDLDLVVGDIRGNVHLLPNEGTAKAWSFGPHRPLQAAGAAIRVPGDAGPFVADWDGDGRADLLVGAGDGSVTLFRNGGKPKEPALEAGRLLVRPQGERRPPEGAKPAERPGMRAKACAADWNGDGRLDLLVGDFASGEGREYHGRVWFYARKAPAKGEAKR